MANILILSESVELKSQLRRHLLDEGYHVVEAKIQALGQFVFNEIDLIILDAITLKNETTSLISEISELKTREASISIVVVVDSGNVQAAVGAMRAGAINAVDIPIDKEMFLESIKSAMLQKTSFVNDQKVIQQAIDLLQSLSGIHGGINDDHSNSQAETIATFANRGGNLEFGDLLINLKQENAFFQDVPLDLTRSQFRLLAELGAAKGRVVPFEELYFHLHHVHLDRSAARTALSAHMSYLRNKLISAGCGEYLVNVRGRGYLLEVPEKTSPHANSINLDLLLEQLPIILWTTDTQLRVTSILGAGLVQLGLESSDVIGLNLTDFPQLDNPHQTITAHEAALLGKSSRYEQGIKNRILQMYIEPSFNEDELIIGCIGLALDITERKEVEEAYQLLVNNSQQGLTIFQNNRFIFANAAVAELTGYTVEELLALDDPIKLFYIEDRPKVYENLRRRLIGEEVPAHSEYRITRKDGAVRWVDQIAFMANFRGQLAIHTAARDKTQEKEAMEAHHQIEEVYRVFVKSLPHMAVLLFDQDLRYIIAEGQALTEMGLHPENMEGKSIWEVFAADQAEVLVPHYRAALDGHETTFELTTNNHIYEVHTLPMKRDNEQIIAGMLIIQDVTYCKR